MPQFFVERNSKSRQITRLQKPDKLLLCFLTRAAFPLTTLYLNLIDTVEEGAERVVSKRIF